MLILEKLATSLGRRDENPNIELAKSIAAQNDEAAVGELSSLLRHKSKDIRHDAVKTLYEIGYLAPAMLVPETQAFLDLLENKSNRLVWGAMTALDAVAAVSPDFVFENLGKIMAAADRGSVITKDHAIGILVKLATREKYRSDALVLLLDLMKNCPTNQFPMYCEMAAPVVSPEFLQTFGELLRSRLEEMDKESKRKRVEKVLKKQSAAHQRQVNPLRQA